MTLPASASRRPAALSLDAGAACSLKSGGRSPVCGIECDGFSPRLLGVCSSERLLRSCGTSLLSASAGAASFAFASGSSARGGATSSGASSRINITRLTLSTTTAATDSGPRQARNKIAASAVFWIVRPRMIDRELADLLSKYFLYNW